MKKNIFKAVLVVIAFILVVAFYNYTNTHYSKECEVTYKGDNLVVVTDNEGYEWEFTVEDENPLQVGNKIKLKMHTNYTSDNIFDDIILNYAYIK